MKSLILSLVLVSGSAHAADRMISVNGQCRKSVVSDRGAITVTVDVVDKTVQSATKQATSTYETVRGAVQKLALRDAEISTSEYSVTEDKVWENKKLVSKGFRARMGLSIATSEVSRIGEVIAIAAKQGIRDVGSLWTYLSEEKSKTERESCLETAVENAFSKATRMAKASGSKVGKPVSIVEEGASHPPTIMARPMETKSMAFDEADSAPSVAASTNNISVNVNVTYSLE